MREIIFDTETTGLHAGEDRLIEIGGVELVNRFPTGVSFHAYVRPAEREVHPDAFNVHGLSNEFLLDKPLFGDIVDDLLEFFGDAMLVAHNASFDIGFLDAEYKRLDKLPVAPERVIDTLALARRRHPGARNSLDALCQRYGIDNSRRTKHGALMDAELLAEVYIEMSGGRQAALTLSETAEDAGERRRTDHAALQNLKRPSPLKPRLSEEEIRAHQAMVETIGDNALWKEVAAAQ